MQPYGISATVFAPDSLLNAWLCMGLNAFFWRTAGLKFPLTEVEGHHTELYQSHLKVAWLFPIPSRERSHYHLTSAFDFHVPPSLCQRRHPSQDMGEVSRTQNGKVSWWVHRARGPVPDGWQPYILRTRTPSGRRLVPAKADNNSKMRLVQHQTPRYPILFHL